MKRCIILILLWVLLPGCTYVTQRRVLELVGEAPDPAHQVEGEGLLKAVDALERQLITLEQNIKEGGLTQEWLATQTHQINSKYEADLRRIYLSDPPGRDAAADQLLRQLDAQELLSQWTRELVEADKQAKMLEAQVSALRASVTQLKGALVAFQTGKGKGRDLKTFNVYLQRSTELLALSHALGQSLAGYTNAQQSKGGTP